MYGRLKVGQLQPTLTFTIYQDYRTKFPAATLTVDLEQDSFIGPYQTIYGIDELFEKGYHAVMLEDWGMIMTEAGLKPFKRQIAYTPGTYLKEEGVYQADGAVQVTKKHELWPYVRPTSAWDDEDDEDEYWDDDNM